MSRAQRIRLTVMLTVTAWLLAVPAAHAYIDPGTGSMLFQALIGGLAAAGTALVLFWHRVTGLFRRAGRTRADHSDAGDAAADVEDPQAVDETL